MNLKLILICVKKNLTKAFNAIFTRGINIANKESMNLVFKQLNEYHKCIAADKRYKIKIEMYTSDSCFFVYKNKRYFAQFSNNQYSWIIKEF